jgi:hypothetical protein
MTTNAASIPRPGDPDFELFKDAVRWSLTDNRKLAEDPAKLLEQALKLTNEAKAADITDIDKWMKGPTGDKVPGQYVDRNPGAFGPNGESGFANEQRPLRQPDVSADDAYKILKTAYDKAQSEEAGKNSRENSKAETATEANRVFTPGAAQLKPAGEVPTPTPPAAENDKKPGPILSVDGDKQKFQAFGDVLQGGWVNNADKSITGNIFHPIEGATVNQVGVTGVYKDGLQSLQGDAQFKFYRDPNKIEGKDTTLNIAGGYAFTPGAGAFAQATLTEGSVGNRFNVKIADGDKGATLSGSATIGTGQVTDVVNPKTGKVTGVQREGQIDVSGEMGPNKTSGSVAYKSNDEVPGHPKAGIPGMPASTSAKISYTDDPTKTQYGVDARFPVNGLSGAISGSYIDNKSGGDTTNVKASLGSRDGLNGLSVSHQDTPKADTTTVGVNLGSPTLNGGVTAAFASEDKNTNTLINAKLNGQVMPNVVAGADVTYDSKQGNVYGKGSLSYVNPNGEFAAGLSVGQDKNGRDYAAAFNIRIGADPNAPRANVDPSQGLERSVVEYKVATLKGDDKKLYDQAVAGVERLNETLEKEKKPKMPVMDTALSLATLADSQKPPLENIRDVQLGKGKDGKEMLIISDQSLEKNPHAPRFAIDRQLAAAINPHDNLDRMHSNNFAAASLAPKEGRSLNDQPANPAQPSGTVDNHVVEKESVAASMRR